MTKSKQGELFRGGRSGGGKSAELAQADPAVKRCIDLFHELFEQKHKFPPRRSDYGRFAKELKRDLLPSWGEDEVVKTLRDFFSTRDARVQQSQYSASDFLFHAQRLRILRNGGQAQADTRTAHNRDAAMRATGRSS